MGTWILSEALAIIPDRLCLCWASPFPSPHLLFTSLHRNFLDRESPPGYLVLGALQSPSTAADVVVQKTERGGEPLLVAATFNPACGSSSPIVFLHRAVNWRGKGENPAPTQQTEQESNCCGVPGQQCLG